MTEVRRSGRARKQVESVYEEARRLLLEKRKRKLQEQEEDDDDEEEEGEEVEDEEESTDDDRAEADQEDASESPTEEGSRREDEDDEDGGDDADEDFEAKAKSPPKKKARPAKSPKKGGTKKVQVQVKPSQRQGRKRGKKVAYVGVGGRGAVQRGINSALNTLAKKVLEHFELPDTSLVAGLLYSHRRTAGGRRGGEAAAVSPAGSPFQRETAYTAQLTVLARDVIETHNADPNAAQVKLLNLLFRSVGGTTDSCLDPEHDRLEDMDNDDWARTVTDLVDEMRHTPADRILLCADPDGAVHASAVLEKGEAEAAPANTAASLGVREYRKIYEEFWYVLGGVALSEGGMASDAARAEVEDEIEDSDDDDEQRTPRGKSPKRRKTPKKKRGGATTFTTTIRFDAELVKDLIGRFIELVSVGQPDVRAAATIAGFQMGRAILDKTILLGSKLEVAKRQHAAATKRGTSPGKAAAGRKAESLKHQIDSLRRTRNDLEEVVTGPVIQGVFIHRYRDSNMHIRMLSILSLSSMMIQRPDMFLMDKYLKYIGWMLSDKAECVRVAGLAGLLSPFEAVHGAGGQPPVPTIADRIDLKLMENVAAKFLPRLADCVIDRSNRVQEKAMALLLSLLRDGFLDEVEDENIWNQINLRALARDASPSTRRDALYFVMEQLEAFDEADEDEGVDDTPTTKKRKVKAASSAETVERRTVQRLDALASWTAHALTDGPIPVDKIRIDLADLVVLALRDMPEHKHIVTDWTALTRAISDDRAATTVQGTTAGDRADVAKQRVLVQMLACAARAEVGDVGHSSFLLGDIDPDVVSHQASGGGNGGGEGAAGGGGRGHRRTAHHASSTAIQHESLSVALLKALPDLLIKFKSDSAVLSSLTSLPRYLLPTVFSLPQRKEDCLALAKNLADIYLTASDEKVLQRTSLSLYYLTEGDHSRAPDARLQLKDVTQELQTRLINLFSKDVSALLSSKRKKSASEEGDGDSPSKRSERDSISSSHASSAGSSPGGGDEDKDREGPSEAEETEYALYLNLKRLRVLAKRCDCTTFFGEDEESDGSENDTSLEALSSVIADGLAARLKAWKVDAGNDEDDERSKSPSPWEKEASLARIVAGSVNEGQTVLLALTAWKLLALQKKESLIIEDDDMEEEPPSDDMEEDIDDHLIIRMRNRIIALVVGCYDQFLDQSGGEEQQYTPEQIAFADFLQASAGQVTSDLRTLFPKEWANAASPLLRAFAVDDDGRLLSGYVRYLRSKEDELRATGHDENKDKDAEKGAVMKLLMPIGRALATNWMLGNRREAGILLSHLTGSSHECHEMAVALSRIFKKIEPVRLLEAQMASLRQGYESWLESEPAEIESERPTDAEMAAFEEEERKHSEQFVQLEMLAAKFSQSLGVGKLSSNKLSPALLGFTREGIKAAFHSDEEWALGSRLSFLNILSKYSNWLKKNKTHLNIVEQDLDEKERLLREDPEFPEVHADDIACLESFRSVLGLKPGIVAQAPADTESNIVEEEMIDSVSELRTPGASEFMTPGTHRSGASRYSRATSAGTLLTEASQFSRATTSTPASQLTEASRFSQATTTTPATHRSEASRFSRATTTTPATHRSEASQFSRATTTTPATHGSEFSRATTTTPATHRSEASRFSRATTTTPATHRSEASRFSRATTTTPGTHGSEASHFSRASSARSSLRSALSPLYETDKSPSPGAEGSGSPSDLSEDVAPSHKATQATVEGEVSDHQASDATEEEESYAGVGLTT